MVGAADHDTIARARTPAIVVLAWDRECSGSGHRHTRRVGGAHLVRGDANEVGTTAAAAGAATMPEDGDGWHQINAGPHLHIMFHPNRQCSAGKRTASNGPRSWSPSRASGSKRSASIPSAVGSHYHIRPSLRGKQLPLWVDEGQRPLDVALAFFEKPLRFRGLLSQAEERNAASLVDDADLGPCRPADPGYSTLLPDTSRPLDGKEQAVADARNSFTARTA